MRILSGLGVVARIFFDEVDAPFCVCLRIDLIVVKRSLPAGAGLRPDVSVDAAQQPFAVDVVAEALDPVREFLRVRLRDAVGVAVTRERDALLSHMPTRFSREELEQRYELAGRTWMIMVR